VFHFARARRPCHYAGSGGGATKSDGEVADIAERGVHAASSLLAKR
jgi:hypothetical protein